MSWPLPPYQWAAAPPPLPNFNPPSVDPHPPPSPSSFYGAQNFPPVAQPQYSIQAGEFHSGDDGLPLPASTSVDWYRPAPPAYSGHEDGLVGSSSSHGQYLDLNLASVAVQQGFQGSYVWPKGSNRTSSTRDTLSCSTCRVDHHHHHHHHK